MAGCLVGGPYVGWLDFFPSRQYRWSLSWKKVEGKIPHPDPEHGSLPGSPWCQRKPSLCCAVLRAKGQDWKASSCVVSVLKFQTWDRAPLEAGVQSPSGTQTLLQTYSWSQTFTLFLSIPKIPSPFCTLSVIISLQISGIGNKKRPLVVNPDVRQGWNPCFNPRRNRCLYKDDPASNSFIGCFFDISLAGLWVNSKSLLILILISSNWDNNERISLFSISSVRKKNFLCFDRYGTNLSLL